MTTIDLRRSRTLARLERIWPGLPSIVRGRHLLAIDVLSIGVALYLAVALRIDEIPDGPLMSLLLPTLLIPLVVRPVVNERFGLYRRVWRYASVPDLNLVLAAAIVGTIVNVVLFVIAANLNVPGSAGFPRSIWAIEALLSLSLMGGSRFVIRAWTEWKSTSGREKANGTPTLLYGAGSVGALMARSARRSPTAGVEPVGFLDDDSNLQGQTIAGLRVHGGLPSLERAVSETGARMLLITMPNAPGSVVRRIMEEGLAAGLEVRTVPPIHELLDGTIDAFRVRRVRVEDLLGRAVASNHGQAVEELIAGRTVMITGAGGSIGSELARQVYALAPAHIILVDRAESPLYTIERELEVRSLHGRGAGRVTRFLGNVASRAMMARLVAQTKPDVIFHAAAYKHVPMMEAYPSEGVHVNVGGTMAMLDAAMAAGVPRFVLVSTDKAVEPTSVMGATKRIAEGLVAAAAAETGLPYVSVRFGNVLGSAGSVVPIFQNQLEHGEPLTVTHPEMTRYFMTIPEAAWLILDAASIGTAGDLFVLDMGEPVRILDLARDLIRLSGRPPESVPIQFTGLRPGEKLHEQLFYGSEAIEATAIPKVLRARGEPTLSDIRERAQAIIATAAGDTDEALREALFGTVKQLSGHPRVDVPATDAGAIDVLAEAGRALGRRLGKVPAASGASLAP